MYIELKIDGTLKSLIISSKIMNVPFIMIEYYCAPTAIVFYYIIDV